jgi:hypothetical protein
MRRNLPLPSNGQGARAAVMLAMLVTLCGLLGGCGPGALGAYYWYTQSAEPAKPASDDHNGLPHCAATVNGNCAVCGMPCPGMPAPSSNPDGGRP